MKNVVRFTVCLLFVGILMVPPASAGDIPPAGETAVVVGRVYHIEGELLRYVPEAQDWVASVKDAPFGTEDTLFSGNLGRAELIVPNGTWIRIGDDTQIQFIALEPDFSEIDVAAGEARFHNKGSDAVIKATSPFGYVLADSGAVFDFYVGDDSAEVVAVKGRVSFVHAATEAKFDVAAGGPSLLADRQQVSSGEGTVDPEWDQWNMAREDSWAAKARMGGRSAEYLPPSLRDEAYALEDNGRWEMVPYEGRECWFWRPTTVVVGWSPFTMGRWTDWYGDQTWIPAEPFGYVTHHYGNWIYTRNRWYWAPPVVRVRAGLPLLDVGFHWFPGRVSWIHSGIYVGWVPLAPRETYYCRRRWGGPHTVVVSSVNVTRITVNVRNYAYINRAIVVNRDNFTRVDNYGNVRVANISRTTSISNYRAAPLVSDTMIANYTRNRQRFNFANVRVNEKPHRSVIDRIQQNRTIVRAAEKENASVVRQRVRNIQEGTVNRGARIDQPRVTNYIVPAGEANRPRGEIRLPQREIKRPPTQPALPPSRPERATPERPAQVSRPTPPPSQPPQTPERAAPASPPQQQRPIQPATPPPGQERVTPERPAQVSRPSPPPSQPPQRPERAAPASPPQQQKPIQPASPPPGRERATPERPAQVNRPSPPPSQPPQRPERVAPASPPQQQRPVQPAPPPPRPERVTPERPAQVNRPSPAPSQPPQRPERVAPASPPQQQRPMQPAPPPPRPERVTPAKPEQQEKSVEPAQPADQPDRRMPARPGQGRR